MIEVTLLGTGSPIPDARRAGPATLVRAGGQTFLVDCGRGVQQRMAAAGVGRERIDRAAADAPAQRPHRRLGRPDNHPMGHHVHARSHAAADRRSAGYRRGRRATLKAFGFDIGYRIAHHADLTAPPAVEVEEHVQGLVWNRDGVRITVAPTDHRPVEPTIAFRVTYDGSSVVLAGDTVPCASLDELAEGAGALVHTVIRKDLIEKMPMQRIRDICDYHSSVEEAAATGTRAGVGILILTHYVPGIEPGQEDDWRALAASEFDQQIELGDDLHRVEVHPGVCAKPAS